MSDEQQTNPIVIKFEFPQVVNEVLKPLATSIGNTLATGWNALTIDIDTWYEKKKIDHNKNLEMYKNCVQKELSAIPEENLQEPKMNILGPSLEASKYYFEEEWYRVMFSKLIAGSCDNRQNEKIHPFFVEAIKQMTPKEAKLISYFKQDYKQPIAVYRYVSPNDNGEIEAFTHVFYMENKYTQPDYYSAAITNLQRLGFLNVNYSRHFIDDSQYDIFKNDPTFIAIKNSINTNPNPLYKDFIFNKGIVKTTELGKNFIDICIQ